ncbi:MAG: 3-hydroxyacyl-ACP dehydratase FabZ [Nitrospirota bacterium]
MMEIDINGIKRLIPQRYPFLMIDRVVSVEPGKEAVAVKNVSANEAFFSGHFPESPVMPGALIIEAMAQTSIVLFAAGKENERDNAPIYYFGSCKARFFLPVVPGDQLKLKVVNVKSLPAGAYVSAEAFVDDKKVSEAELVFSVKNE